MAMNVYSSDTLVLLRDRPLYERDTSSQTEQAGYVDAKTQVTRLMAAGVNLLNYRRAYYEYPDGNVPADAKPDPTLDVGFDLADGDAIVGKLNSKLDAAKASKDIDAAARKASNKAEEGTTEAGAEA